MKLIKKIYVIFFTLFFTAYVFPDDAVLRIHIDRCLRYKQTPPEKNRIGTLRLEQNLYK